MTTEYASRGLIGVLTPQANTTVEPEYSLLSEPGISCIAARLSSSKKNMNPRLVDYFDSAEQVLGRFANAPVGVVAFACTGSAYFAGIEAEHSFIERVTRTFGYPMVTATGAITQVLEILRAKRIAFVSPYNDELHLKAMQYWRSRGLQISSEMRLAGSSDDFHPIYTLRSKEVGSTIQLHPDLVDADAVLLLGTGMPSLSTILHSQSAGLPVLSTNLCQMWVCTNMIANWEDAEQSLKRWLSGEHWAATLNNKIEKTIDG